MEAADQRVARTLAALQGGLEIARHEVVSLTPDLFRTAPCPTQSEVRLALLARPALTRRLDAFAPEAIHIATEGPLGLGRTQLLHRAEISLYHSLSHQIS